MIFESILRALYCMSFGKQRLGFRGENICRGQLAHENNEFLPHKNYPLYGTLLWPLSALLLEAYSVYSATAYTLF